MEKRFNFKVSCTDETNGLYAVNLRSWEVDAEGQRQNETNILKGNLTKEQMLDEINQLTT